MVSDFEVGQLTTASGAGWAESTDKLFGGSSTVAWEEVDGGANQTQRALQLTGKVQDNQPAFAGLMFSPGPQPMVPGDISNYGSLSFWAKGDGQTYSVMFFTKKQGMIPSIKTFAAGPDWQKYSFPFADFAGTNGNDVLGIFFGGTSAGDFAFQIDEVEFAPKVEPSANTDEQNPK